MDFSNFSSSDWQSFSYSALLLIILIISLSTRREFSFGKVLKYLAIWSATILFLVGLYSYRYEFADLKKRIYSELNPAAAQINQNQQIIIRASEDGHFYVDTKINGAAVRFMIDTGASDIALNLTDAAKIGINTTNLNFNKRYQTANGTSFGASVTLEKVEIAGVKFINLPASINSGNMGISLLGMSFLKRLKKYEVFQDKLILTISS